MRASSPGLDIFPTRDERQTLGNPRGAPGSDQPAYNPTGRRYFDAKYLLTLSGDQW